MIVNNYWILMVGGSLEWPNHSTIKLSHSSLLSDGFKWVEPSCWKAGGGLGGLMLGSCLPPGHEAQHPHLVGSHCIWSARTTSFSLLLWLLLRDEQKSFCHVLLTGWHTRYMWEGSFTFLIPHPHPGRDHSSFSCTLLLSRFRRRDTRIWRLFRFLLSENLSFAPNVWSPV